MRFPNQFRIPDAYSDIPDAECPSNYRIYYNSVNIGVYDTDRSKRFMALKAPIHQFTETRTIHISGRDFLYISNLISAFRLLIVPVLFWLIYTEKYKLAILVGGIAVVSDLLDGFFARVLNQHSELGYILDPVADKFAHWCGNFRTCVIKVYFSNMGIRCSGIPGRGNCVG